MANSNTKACDLMMKNFKKETDVIYVAASDSTESDKIIADFVCNGKNDEITVQQAINEISNCAENNAVGKRIILLSGNYYISDFPYENECGKAAVMIGDETNSFEHIGILIAGSEHTESTCIHVTDECYNSLAPETSYSIFACKGHNWNHHVFKDLYVTVPDNQKNIICFDGRLMGSMGLTRCKCICSTRGDWSHVNSQLPSEGFVAFMGTYGSNNMWQSKWEFCQAEGFGQGFAVGSEHLLIYKCAAAFGLYGYTFNNYRCDFGAIVHPITLISCSDEANANLWKFSKNNYKQCINAYNISFECVPSWFALGGSYATEENPGDYVGHIDYVANMGFHNENSPKIPFWAKESGKNFDTVNNVHKKVCTSAERQSYAANIGQEIFDTDLNKKLVYIDYNVWVDAFGNKAE